jgi:hypothetical protein
MTQTRFLALRTNGTQTGRFGGRGSQKDFKNSLKVGRLAFRNLKTRSDVREQLAFP